MRSKPRSSITLPEEPSKIIFRRLWAAALIIIAALLVGSSVNATTESSRVVSGVWVGMLGIIITAAASLISALFGLAKMWAHCNNPYIHRSAEDLDKMYLGKEEGEKQGDKIDRLDEKVSVIDKKLEGIKAKLESIEKYLNGS